MILDKSPNRLKLCLDIRLIGDSTIQISPMQIDEMIGNFQNKVFHICNNGYVFEKTYYTMKYSHYRLIIPPYIDRTKGKASQIYTFLDDETRYKALKKLKEDLCEFTRNGIFGYNPYSRVLTHETFWFVY